MEKRRPRQLFEEFTEGLQEVAKSNGEEVRIFMGMLGSYYKPGAIDVKTKELISVAIGIYNRCEYCIVYHVYKAMEAGANREEIMEAAMVAVSFGGGPSMAFTAGLLKDAIQEFEPDFK